MDAERAAVALVLESAAAAEVAAAAAAAARQHPTWLAAALEGRGLRHACDHAQCQQHSTAAQERHRNEGGSAGGSRSAARQAAAATAVAPADNFLKKREQHSLNGKACCTAGGAVRIGAAAATPPVQLPACFSVQPSTLNMTHVVSIHIIASVDCKQHWEMQLHQACEDAGSVCGSMLALELLINHLHLQDTLSWRWASKSPRPGGGCTATAARPAPAGGRACTPPGLQLHSRTTGPPGGTKWWLLRTRRCSRTGKEGQRMGGVVNGKAGRGEEVGWRRGRPAGTPARACTGGSHAVQHLPGKPRVQYSCTGEFT